MSPKTVNIFVAALLIATDLFAASYTYVVRTDGNVAITAFSKSTSGAVTVPSTVAGKTVVALQGAFNGCKKVTSVTIPATVTVIGENTFKKTSKLTNVKFADGSPGVYIGEDAFNGSKLKNLSIPANSIVDDFAFYGSKITTLEVNDEDPSTNLANVDLFLNPYNSAGTKLKCEINTLIVPTGCVGVYTPCVPEFLYGRQKKKRGTVRAQYPRVFVQKTYNSDGVYQGSGYFKVNGKKVANGTRVKPGTKKVQFVAAAVTGFAPQRLQAKIGNGVFENVGTDYLSTHSFTMPEDNKTYRATFISFSDEKIGIDTAASAIKSKAETIAIKGKTAVNIKLFSKGALNTRTSVKGKDLPKGLSLKLESDTYYYVKGVPTTALPASAPAFVALVGASGYSRIVRLPLEVIGGKAPSSTMTVNTGISQSYADGVVGVLAGLNYSKNVKPVLFSATAKMSAKASGLPPGIKLVKLSKKSYTLAGRPSKPGVYSTTVKVKIGKTSEVHRIAYEVNASPLAGAYRGFAASAKLGCATATMSVAKDGKATLTLVEGSKKTKVSTYPSVDSGFTWSANSPLNGRFRYSFTLPKDKKRKIGKRPLKMAFLTDLASGVSGVPRVRQGPLSGFSLKYAEVLRMFPVYSVQELRSTAFYKSSPYRRDNGGFSLQIGPTTSAPEGEAMWAVADYDYETGKAFLNGRLPAGKLFSATVPLVAAYHALESWSFSETRVFRAVEAAPLVVTDTDGAVYVVKIPTDPSEFTNGGNQENGHDSIGFYAWNRYGDRKFERLTGAYAYNNRKTKPGSAFSVMGKTSATLKFTFSPTQWSSATSLHVSIDSYAVNVNYQGKVSYEFDPATGLWSFPFTYGGLTYLFEGVPTSWTQFRGMMGCTADGETWQWGAATVE